jgi:hypothetical protein
VDPIPDPLLLRKSGIEPGPSGSVARNSDHYTAQAIDATFNTCTFLFQKEKYVDTHT